jgi:Nodulin-like
MPPPRDFVQGVRVSGYWSKWLTFSAATLVMLSAGLSYTFSVWSNMLKTHFKYTQTQVAGVGTAGNMVRQSFLTSLCV